MADQDIVAAARALKVAHIRADALGGEHQATASRAYANLLDAVGDVDEPEEVTAYRAEVAAIQAQAQPATPVDVSTDQPQTASLQTNQESQP